MTTMSHVCIRVLDLDRSLTFYRDALGLVPQREMTMEDRGWHLVFLGDNETPFQLELCKEIARTQPYRLGDDTPHVAVTAKEFEALKARHRAEGRIVDELAGGHLLHPGPRRAPPRDSAPEVRSAPPTEPPGRLGQA